LFEPTSANSLDRTVPFVTQALAHTEKEKEVASVVRPLIGDQQVRCSLTKCLTGERLT
jgi:hypothetical protein